MAEGDTFVNALIGAVVTFVAGSIAPPVGPVVGGVAAGYLEGGERPEGVRVGVYAGLLGLVPLVGFLLFVGTLLSAVGLGVGMFAGPPGLLAGGFGLFLVLASGVFAVYVVVLSAAGGWIGNYVKYDADL